MERIVFEADNGDSETLRPTHALQVAVELGQREVTGRNLAAACDAVRDRYRCRTVRKELRRVRLLGEAVPTDIVKVSCADDNEISAFEEARKPA